MKRECLPSEWVQTAIEANYDVQIIALNFLQCGYDPYSSNYEIVTSDQRRFFVKLFKNQQQGSYLSIPAYLCKVGLLEVVAPLKNYRGSFKTLAQDYCLALFPYLDARPASNVDLTLSQWQELGQLLRRVHDVQLPSEMVQMMPSLPWMQSLKTIENLEYYQEKIKNFQPKNDVHQAFIVFWRDKINVIRALLERFAELTILLQEQSLVLVLCHGDFHTGNILVSEHGSYYLVDWDSPLLAPPEADFNFVLSCSHDVQEAFFRGYGDHAIDYLLVTYYNFKWALQEIDEYTEIILDDHDERIADALEEFRILFDPLRDVQRAFHVDDFYRAHK